MSGFEEETYSTIFTSLKHPVRRKILRILSEKPRNFSEILEALGISSSHLTYHLENLGELVSKTDDGRYKLSTFGEAAVGTMSRVEEVPKATEVERFSSFPTKWRTVFVALMIGLVALASISCVQYLSLNRMSAEHEQLSAEYEQLKELVEFVEKGESMRSEYTLRYEEKEFVINVTIGEAFIYSKGPVYCVIYNPYDNSTLDLFLLVHSIPSESYVPISVQEGDAFVGGTDEAAPIIWSVNATERYSIYSVPLASKGLYTISLVGPITHTGMGRTFKRLWGVDCEMSLSIIYEGEFSPFIVIERP